MHINIPYVLIAAGTIPLIWFAPNLIKILNPFHRSRLKAVAKIADSSGDAIFIFRWRTKIEKDRDPKEEMSRIGIAFISEAELRNLIWNQGLPKSYSISIETPEGTVITLDVNDKLPHDIWYNHIFPSSSMDYYAGMRVRKVNLVNPHFSKNEPANRIAA